LNGTIRPTTLSCKAERATRIVLLAHAINVRPEAFSEPANLAKDLFAAHHFFFAIGDGGRDGEFVDEAAACVNEFTECGGGPIRYEGLMEGGDVGFCGGA
jgi:hypothetical protein